MISLTVPLDPGPSYADGPYTHAKITMVARDDVVMKFLFLVVDYGSEAGGEFVKNTTDYPGKSEDIMGTDYDTYKGLATNNGESVGDAESRCRHQCMIDLGLYAGTVV